MLDSTDGLEMSDFGDTEKTKDIEQAKVRTILILNKFVS